MYSRTSAYCIYYVVLPIPFVNMDPNNLSTMYICMLSSQYHSWTWIRTTYRQILDVAEKRNTCGWYCINITVDHPFYANAREIVLAEGSCSPLSGVVIRLGGSIGTIVAGNGTDAFSILGTSIHQLNEIICVEQCCSHDEWKCMC